MNSTVTAKARRTASAMAEWPAYAAKRIDASVGAAARSHVTRKQLEWLIARPIAHRGYHDQRHGRPENTLAAFAAAVKARFAIECDLHVAADRVPVVFHDDMLERLTGISGHVRDLTSAELRELRIAGTGEWIPRLDELLSLVAGRVPLIIELKHVAGRDFGLAAEAVDQLKRYSGPAALMSFDPALIREVRNADPDLPRGLTAMGDWRCSLQHLRAVLALGVDFVSYRVDDLPTPMPLVARHLLGLPLICWTVRTEEQRQRADRWTDQITFEGFSA
jgi:glycerophosphoryl diester phosphodiesterase